ncbi:MAG: DUF2007 domain-containing protein [Rikenella sp.]|nr:DUF2007 domain-containing protein [Rikenella sp.]
MKIIGIYSDCFQASLIKGRLEQAGIEACLLNEHANNLIPYSSAIEEMQVRVAVADEDYEAAAAVVNEIRNEAESSETDRRRCPFCGSERVVFGLKGPSRWKKISATILATLTMSPLGKVRCHYFCEDCRQEF